MDSDNYRLQFITHYNKKYSYEDSARIALEGGCRWIQLRMKDVEESILEESAIKIQKMCKDYGATFIINDNVSLAKNINADGVHLGKTDMSIVEAREILGQQYIIGCTVNSIDDVLLNTQTAIPDYFGCGPYRFTSTKKNLASILGYDGYRRIINEMKEKNIHVPVVAIGGICKEDVLGLLRCGVSGIALSSSVLNAEKPIKELKEITKIIFNNH